MSIALTNGHGPQIGDPCPREKCTGVLKVGTTKVIAQEGIRKRFLVCRKCGCSPENNIQIVPLHYAPPQSPRPKKS